MATRTTTTSAHPSTPQPVPATVTASQALKGKDVQVQLQYLKDDPLYKTVKPLQITPNFADREGKSNVRLAAGPSETINDVRGISDTFSLDDNGFTYVKAPTTFKDWGSQPKIAQQFLPEMEALLKREVDGCDEIMFYDARIRQEGDEGLRVEGLSYNPFARQVHTDNTEISVLAKIHNLTEMKAEYLLSGRARIINIWRPIKHPVYDNGLAIADGGKLQDGDVKECDRHRADTGQYWDTMGVIQYRPGFKWYYMSEQAEEDVLLFKNYDSATDVQARQCLHTAFDLPPESIPAGAPTRESIEVRALIFTYPKDAEKPHTGWATQGQHPLAISLEQGGLKRLDDEHTITDRLRTDIDEGNEVKDAVLLLRRQEIRRLEKVRDALMTERDVLQKDLIALQKDIITSMAERDQARSELAQVIHQNGIQAARIDALQSEVQALEEQLEQFNTPSQTDSLRDGTERTNFSQMIERQRQEIEKWKLEAMGRGNVAVSMCWQGSVDEAVRREREKDAFVIQALRDEIARLQVSSPCTGGGAGA